jgi:hypothetical protein
MIPRYCVSVTDVINYDENRHLSWSIVRVGHGHVEYTYFRHAQEPEVFPELGHIRSFMALRHHHGVCHVLLPHVEQDDQRSTMATA